MLCNEEQILKLTYLFMIITLLEYFHILNIHFQSQEINLLTKINLSQTYFIIFHTLMQLVKILLNCLN
jgi:hypothetical protein